MRLNKLYLNNFKNYQSIELDLSHRINVFVGLNGAGKTNILDAIYYLSFCKSYFNSIDSQNIRHGEEFYMIQGDYTLDNDSMNKVSCSFKRGDGKHFSMNKKTYDRLADHIGKIPLVIIAPSDSILIHDGSEERRKYMDGVISQFDASYLSQILDYNKILKHRNRQLKSFFESRTFDVNLLEIWDYKLSEVGQQIFEKRKSFLEDFIPVIHKYFQFISPGTEEPDISYKSEMKTQNLSELLTQNQQKDRMLTYTSSGAHRDDLVFTINGYPIRKYGSQGQQKSFLLALKLAQFEFIKEKKGYKPLLLLDDVFDKLDRNRVKQLMKLVSDETFGQIFITDTNSHRIQRVFSDIDVDIRILEIEEGIAISTSQEINIK